MFEILSEAHFCRDCTVEYELNSDWYMRKRRYFDTTLRLVEMDYKMIMRRYVRGGTFLPDLLGSIPTDLFFVGSWNEHVVARELSTMIYAFRLFSAYSYIARMLNTYGLAQAPYGFFHVLPWLLIGLHWLACITWIVPIVTVTLEAPERPRNASWTNIDDLWSGDSQARYWSCWSRSVATFTRSGFLHPEPTAAEDQYIGIVLQLLGTLVFCILIAQLMQYFRGSKSSKLQYRATVAQLRQYMRHRQLQKAIQRRFIAYYEFRYQHRYFRETEILGTLSSQMRQEIGMHSCRKLVENVTFFNNLPISLLTRIVALLKSETFLANDVIVRANQTGDCMYFIATGTVAIYANSGREICHLEDGAHFGEIALVMPDERRVASVVAVEVCELYRLERADFVRTIHPYPMLWERIKKIAIERHEKTAIINAQ